MRYSFKFNKNNSGNNLIYSKSRKSLTLKKSYCTATKHPLCDTINNFKNFKILSLSKLFKNSKNQNLNKFIVK